ncbi:MAG TPA: ATP-binding protein [Pirellulales bacterium]
MVDRIFQRFGEHHILVMMVTTRFVDLVAGGLTVYYISLMPGFAPDVKRDFFVCSMIVVGIALLLTTLLALGETVCLRRAIKKLRRGERIDERMAEKAGIQAVRFPGRHCLHESLLNPPCMLAPVCIYMRLEHAMPTSTLVQIVVGGALGIIAAILMTFFVAERWMAPIVRFLLARGVAIEFDALPPSRLYARINLCVSMVVVLTTVLIGSLANQRAEDIINNPADQQAAVANLREHTVYITLTAVAVGLVLSRLLATSIASRVRLMVEAMQRVQQGALGERLRPTGTDEVDNLARQFNRMVGRLEHNDHTIRDLNANLEFKVKLRTKQLSFSRRKLKRSFAKLRRLHQDLDKRNRELETAYRDLSSMQGQLIHAEKMSSLGQLVAGLAHEINNSINAVYNGIKPLGANTNRLQGMLQPVLAQQCDPAVREEIEGTFKRLFSLANVIENGATRTARIIADLKTFSHPGKEDFDDFDLHESLDMCLNLLFSQVKHRITLERQYGEVATVHGPHGHLNQVFMNILNNAQQAIDGEGRITITTRQQGDMASVSIRDTGPGIPEEIKHRIFDPFFTTKDPGLGTGLGLSISYGIVSRLGGAIECHSERGHGTEFVVTFPLHGQPKPKEERAEAMPPIPGVIFAAPGAAYAVHEA